MHSLPQLDETFATTSLFQFQLLIKHTHMRICAHKCTPASIWHTKRALKILQATQVGGRSANERIKIVLFVIVIIILLYIFFNNISWFTLFFVEIQLQLAVAT